MENILSFILYITVYLISAVLMTRSIKKNRKILFIIALTIPIKAPAVLNNPPPELPELIATSV